jgi:hypothetical protein
MTVEEFIKNLKESMRESGYMEFTYEDLIKEGISVMELMDFEDPEILITASYSHPSVFEAWLCVKLESTSSKLIETIEELIEEKALPESILEHLILPKRDISLRDTAVWVTQENKENNDQRSV